MLKKMDNLTKKMEKPAFWRFKIRLLAILILLFLKILTKEAFLKTLLKLL